MKIVTKRQDFTKNEAPCYQSIIRELPDLTRKMFQFLYCSQVENNWFYSAFPQEFIANKFGISTKTVQRKCAVLKELNLISIEHRFNNSCIYRVNPVLLQVSVRKLIYDLFRKTILVLSLLFSCDNKPQMENVHLKKNEGIILNDISLTKRDLGGEHNRLGSVSPGRNTTFLEKDRKVSRKVPIVNYDHRSDYIARISSSLPLTEHGTINLKKYHYRALKHASNVIQSIVMKEDPYRYLLSVCENYSRENNLMVERREYEQERNNKNIKFDDTSYINLERFEELKAKRAERAAQIPAVKNTFIPPKLPTDEQLLQWRQEIASKPADNPFMRILQNGFKEALSTQCV